MKRIFGSAILIAFTLLFSGCSKDSTDAVPGTYTYKISGTVTLMPAQLAGLDAATLAAYKAAGIAVDPVTVGLYPEQGQMHIIEDGDRVIVTLNDILGNADVTTATVNGRTLTLAGTDMKAAQLTDGIDKIGAGMVVYGGTGSRYDDMLIIDLQYQGQFTVNDILMTVISSDVNCVAQSN